MTATAPGRLELGRLLDLLQEALCGAATALGRDLMLAPTTYWGVSHGSRADYFGACGVGVRDRRITEDICSAPRLCSGALTYCDVFLRAFGRIPRGKRP